MVNYVKNKEGQKEPRGSSSRKPRYRSQPPESASEDYTGMNPDVKNALVS